MAKKLNRCFRVRFYGADNLHIGQVDVIARDDIKAREKALEQFEKNRVEDSKNDYYVDDPIDYATIEVLANQVTV